MGDTLHVNMPTRHGTWGVFFYLLLVANTDEKFHHMSRQAAYVLNAVTNSDIRIEEDKEDVDMCLAIQGIRQDGVNEGRLEGEANGRLYAERETAIRMIKKNKLSLEEIADYVSMSLEDIEKLAEEVMQPS